MPNDEYARKLKDPRWQKRRLEILERDEWMCQICYDSESTLVVHHRKYLPNTEPWDSPDDLLVTLCELCHETERESRQEYEHLLLDNLRSKFFADDLRQLAYGFSNLELLHESKIITSVIEMVLSSSEIQRELLDSFFCKLKVEGDKRRGDKRRGEMIRELLQATL